MEIYIVGSGLAYCIFLYEMNGSDKYPGWKLVLYVLLSWVTVMWALLRNINALIKEKQ